MSASSRSRQKHKLEPITLDELAGTTGMSGFGSLFTRDLSQTVPLLERIQKPQEESAPETGAPGTSADEIGAHVSDNAIERAGAHAVEGAPGTSAPDLAEGTEWREVRGGVTVGPVAPETGALVSPAVASSAGEQSAPAATAHQELAPSLRRISVDPPAASVSTVLEKRAVESGAPDSRQPVTASTGTFVDRAPAEDLAPKDEASYVRPTLASSSAAVPPPVVELPIRDLAGEISRPTVPGRTTEAIAGPRVVDSGAPVSPAPPFGALIPSAPLLTKADNRRESAPLQHAPLATPPRFPTADDDIAPSYAFVSQHGLPSQPIYRRPRIREAVTVQDGHTLAEQSVYDAMYRAGQPYQGESRILTIGLRTLAEMSRLAYSNCKANVRTLIEKLAIDGDDAFSYTAGRTYVIYSFREILRRRKAAGLTHVLRTRGVVFVDPATGEPLQQSASAPESPAPDSGAPLSHASALESTNSPAPELSQSGAPVPLPHIRNRNIDRNTNEQTPAPPLVVQAILDIMGKADEAAAVQIHQGCLETAPDVTAAEIAHFIRQEGPALRRNRALDNPMGVLIRHIPRCCRGENLRHYRQTVLHEQERNQRQLANWIADARQILANPQATAADRGWAEDILATYGEGQAL